MPVVEPLPMVFTTTLETVILVIVTAAPTPVESVIVTIGGLVYPNPTFVILKLIRPLGGFKSTSASITAPVPIPLTPAIVIVGAV